MNESKFRWPFRNPRDLVEELFQACAWETAGEPFEAALKAADWLFGELIQRLEINETRTAWLQAMGEGGKIAKELKHRMLKTRLKLMRDEKTGRRKPNIQRLAAAIVAENEAFNKSPKRNGAPARSTNQPSIEKQIRRLRDAELADQSAPPGQSPQPRPKKKVVIKGAVSKKQHAPKRKATHS